MATRVTKKQAAPKEKEVAPPLTPTKGDGAADGNAGKSPKKKAVRGGGIAKKLAPKTPAKKVLKIKLKAKAKKPVKLKQKLAKALLKNVKIDKKLLKNGIKERKKVTRKPKEKPLPVLEPIFPQEENVEIKKQPKKRAAKKATKADDMKIKVEPLDDTLSVASDITDVSTSEATPRTKRPRLRKNNKPAENESIEDVMNDLSFLIKSEDEIKKEADSMSESSRSDSVRPKKITKRQRLEILKEKIIKKENIENTLAKLNSADQKVIDMLDLNVRKVKKQPLRRRHSIEKFPVGSKETNPNPVALFGALPRCISPRSSKRTAKPRPSFEGLFLKKSSPYTRSDSAARILRNGKRSKLRDMNLLEGLVDERTKKKNYVDLSGSESISKNSGYDSDSSFSDLSSLHGEQKDSLRKDSVSLPANVEDKKEETITSPKEVMDTNSNVCDNVKPTQEALELKKKEVISEKPVIAEQLPPLVSSSPSAKVPEKNIILDIMKQTFNEDVEREKNQTPKTCNTSKFYGKNKKEEFLPPAKVETVEPDVPPKEEPLVEAVKEDEKVEEKTEEIAVVPEKKEEKPIDLVEDKDSSIEEKETKIPIPEILVKQDETCNEANIPEMPNLEKENLPEDTLPVIDKMTELIEIVQDENMDSEPPKLEKNVETEPVPKLDPEKPVEVTIFEDIKAKENIAGPSKELIEEKEEDVQIIEEPKTVEKEQNELEEKVLEELNDEIKVLANPALVESPEELEKKENILKALGLQSWKAAEKAKTQTKGREKPSTSKGDNYTGTLKTVIKINRDNKKKGKNSLKMTLQKNKGKSSNGDNKNDDHRYKIMKEGGSNWKHHSKEKDSSDTAGAHRKSHYSNRSNLDGSSEHTSDGEGSQEPAKDLVIPEKASSFSIHPGRLCKDECSYCFGKFGLFDTPCHIAQMKSVERQNKILATEKHLTRDSCLCDACYRHVDRKANTPSYSNKSFKRNSLVAPGPRQNCCHVLGCSNASTNILRRKWIIKMRKNICNVINIDLDNPGLHSIPICDEHYAALEHLMVCAMCKRRLARNHIHYLGPEVQDLNKALIEEGIPLALSDKPVVCKLCKCFTSIILKNPEDRKDNGLDFMLEYKKRILHFNDIIPMDAAAAEEPLSFPAKNDKNVKDEKKKKKIEKLSPPLPTPDVKNDIPEPEKMETEEEKVSPEIVPEVTTERVQKRVPSTERPEPPKVHLEPAQPAKVLEPLQEEIVDVECNSVVVPPVSVEIIPDIEPRKEPKKTTVPPATKISSLLDVSKTITPSVNVIELENNKNCEIAVQRLGSNPSISVRQLFPGEEDLPLEANVDFGNVKEKTPEGWEKCISTIQYDEETRKLWQELQKPYGNQSSFLRHLILLEKYFRNGDLVLSSTASHHATNYRESVTNRLRAYDNIPSNAASTQPLTMMQFNKMQKSNSGIITSTPIATNSTSGGVAMVQIQPVLANSAPITLQQLNSPPLIPASNVLSQIAKPKNPPGLMPLQPGTTRPMAPSRHQPNSHKIKFPITKNWRPNLIPIDPTKKTERRAGLVQVISGGRPYHITLEDYKKMCAIKRSYEAKQRKMQDAQKPFFAASHNSILKSSNKGKPSAAVVHHPSNGESSAENILEKLDKQIEKIGQEQRIDRAMLLPKIPKSLTVIPQTVRKQRPPSPVVMIHPKPAGS